MALMDRIDVVVNCTPICVKIKFELTNLMKINRIEGYMGQIHKELWKFLMISSNLIKSDDESMIEIGENDIL